MKLKYPDNEICSVKYNQEIINRKILFFKNHAENKTWRLVADVFLFFF